MFRVKYRVASIGRYYSSHTGPAGFKLPSYPVTWRRRDALLFANSIGCKSSHELHFLYELHPKFAVFPTYASVLPFKKNSDEVVDYLRAQGNLDIPGVPAFNSSKALDGQRQLQVYKPLPKSSDGNNFEIRSTILGVYDKGKSGSVVETEHLLVEANENTPYVRMVSSKFFVGQGEWGGSKGPATPKYQPPEGREQQPDRVGSLELSEEAAHLYRLNGDYNPLHATPEPGRQMGLGGTIVHGLLSWNATANILLREFGGSEPENLKDFQARFAAPVKPGSRLDLKMWKTGTQVDGLDEIRFIAEVEGKAVLNNGRALVRLTERET